MSVIMLQWAKGDPHRLEEYAAQNPEGIQEIIAQAKEHGLIAHRFYGSEGQILIADEWPDEESFVRFAEAAQPRIEPMFEAAGRDRRASYDLAKARNARRSRLGSLTQDQVGVVGSLGKSPR